MLQKKTHLMMKVIRVVGMTTPYQAGQASASLARTIGLFGTGGKLERVRILLIIIIMHFFLGPYH